MTAPAAARYSAHVFVTGVDPRTLELVDGDGIERVTREFVTPEGRDAWVVELDNRSVLVHVIAYVDVP